MVCSYTILSFQMWVCSLKLIPSLQVKTSCSCSHLTALGVQAHSHGSPLHKCWKLSDYCQELVAANMKQLHVERVRWSECGKMWVWAKGESVKRNFLQHTTFKRGKVSCVPARRWCHTGRGVPRVSPTLIHSVSSPVLQQSGWMGVFGVCG